MSLSTPRIPKAFEWKRWHSLTGLWLVLYLTFHLMTNSQAALWVGDYGSGFIKAVNDIQALPYLQAIEIGLLAIPFLVHMVWGVQYLFTGKINSFKSDGTAPSMDEYPRNHAYTWQRITSWILLILITFHVIHMRFMESPVVAHKGPEKYFMVRLENDSGLASLSQRLGVELYNQKQVRMESDKEDQKNSNWVSSLNKRPLQTGQVIAVAENFGTAELLMVRETFKNPAMLVLYTVLVLSACFHAYNGLWTFLITWGATLSVKSQKFSRKIATVLMVVVTLLGLAAIWGTYWVNLRY